MDSETKTSESQNLVDIDELRQELDAQKPADYTWRHENGRRYASDEVGSYFLPNDDPEIERLNQQHWTLTKAKGGKNFNAPIDPNREGFKILDIGCGSGLWSMQMAEAFPQCSIVGVDISPIQPKDKPANVEWVLHNVETEEWPFPKQHFDYIRLSLLNGSFANFSSIVPIIMDHLKPGGYVEQQEWSLGRAYILDDNDNPIALPSEIDDLPPVIRWTRLMEAGAEKRGRSFKLAPKLTEYYSQAGCQHVTEDVYRLPIGTWPKTSEQKLIGSHMVLDGTKGMDGLSMMLFTKALGWSVDATKDFLAEVKKDLLDNSAHKCMDLHVVYAQKAL